MADTRHRAINTPEPSTPAPQRRRDSGGTTAPTAPRHRHRRHLRAGPTAVVAALLAAALWVPASVARSQAQPADAPQVGVDQAAADEVGQRPDPIIGEVVDAPSDAVPQEFRLGSAPDAGPVSADMARARVPLQVELMDVDRRVQEALGDRFGGSWIDASGQLLSVGVTSEADAALVRTEGGVPVTVDLTYAQLLALKDEVEEITLDNDIGIRALYPAIVDNMIVLETSWGTDREVMERLADLLALKGPVQVRSTEPSNSDQSSPDQSAENGETEQGAPEDPILVPGDAEEAGADGEDTAVGPDRVNGGYYISGTDGSWCSLAFAARKNYSTPIFLTAGHCLDDTAELQYREDHLVGIPYLTLFGVDGHDSASGLLNNVYAKETGLVESWGNGPDIEIVGRQPAPVGAVVCNSGSRTGLSCGRILAHDLSGTATVGSRKNFTMTSICTNHGDSGGATLTLDGQAQGIHSGRYGGFDGCAPSAAEERGYFESIDSVLAAHDVTLQLGAS